MVTGSATAQTIEYITDIDQLSEPTVVNIYDLDGYVVATDEGVNLDWFVDDDSKEWVVYDYRDTYYLYNLGTKAFLSVDTENSLAITDNETVPDVRLLYIDRLDGWAFDCGGSLLGLSSSKSSFVFLDDVKDSNNVIFTITPSLVGRELTDEENATILETIKAKFEDALQPYREFVANAKAFKASDTNLAGYAGNYDTSDLENALENKSLAEIDVAYQKALLTRLPKAGHYYHIVNYARPNANSLKNYLHLMRDKNNALNSSGITSISIEEAVDNSKEDLCLFSFEYGNAGPYQVKVKVAATGTYFGTESNGVSIPATSTVDNATVYELEPMSDFSQLFRFKYPNSSRWLTVSGICNLVPYSNVETAMQWYFEEATEISGIKLDSEGYALIDLPCPVKMPTDVEFYVADEIKTDGTVVMTQLNGTVLPANTPVLIHSVNATEPLTLDICTDNEVEYNVTHNLLAGTNVILTDVTTYAMQINADGSLQLGEDQTGTILPNSAYILSDGNNIYSGITDVTTESPENTDNDVWYDLNGRRIVHPDHGIYLNGTQHKLELRKSKE
jgi:hypothetical protein